MTLHASMNVVASMIAYSVAHEQKMLLGLDLVKLSLTRNKPSTVEMNVMQAPLLPFRKYFLLKETIIDFRELNCEWSS